MLTLYRIDGTWLYYTTMSAKCKAFKFIEFTTVASTCIIYSVKKEIIQKRRVQSSKRPPEVKN